MICSTGLRLALPAVGLALVACAALAVQAGTKVTMDGSVISSDVRMVNGRPYVPLSDLAKAIDRAVVRKGTGYALTQVGGGSGGTPIAMIAGNSLSRSWRFTVASVDMVGAYTPSFGADKTPIAPQEAGDVLAVIGCRLTNGAKAMRVPSFDKSSSGNTAVMDNRKRAYVPLAYDLRTNGDTVASMPPGSQQDFAVIFSVPSDAGLDHLTYSVGGSAMDTSTDYQVALRK